jgi:hypothetical protein
VETPPSNLWFFPRFDPMSTTAKHWFVGLTNEIAWIFAPLGVNVNLRYPGWTRVLAPQSSLGWQHCEPDRITTSTKGANT